MGRTDNLVANLAARASIKRTIGRRRACFLNKERHLEKAESDSHGGRVCPERSTRVDSDRERREAELRREAEFGRTSGSPAGVPGAGAHRVERASQEATRS